MIDQKLLREDFPKEALSNDNSRGFSLTSIKAMFIIERLNDVFGLCGIGWRYAHSPVQDVNGELIVELAFQYAVENGGPFYLHENGEWVGRGTGWSQPVFAFGGKKISKNGMSPYTDTCKSVVTDALTKAASIVGVGTSVFKGQGNLESDIKSLKSNSDTRPTVIKTASATDFYAAQKKKYGTDIPPEIKQVGLDAASQKITWKEAIARL